MPLREVYDKSGTLLGYTADGKNMMPATPENRYEAAVGKLPNAAQVVAPSTMGEAGFMAGGAGLAGLAALGLAPETMGASLIPIGAAMIGGALEDPNNRLGGAAWEGAKGIGQELGGRALTFGTELGARFLGKSGILERSAERMAKLIPGIFSSYPLKALPRTAEDLQDQLGGGKVIEAAGKRLGDFRDALQTRFGKYAPAIAPKLVNASSGVMPHYTSAVAASGQAFLIPDLDESGNIVMRRMGVGDAIDHVREMLAGSRTSTGLQKSTASAPKALEVAHKAQDALTAQLNALEQGVGDKYRGLSTDYGLARQLQKVFAGSTRTTSIAGDLKGVIDQPKVLTKADQVAAKVESLKPGGGTALRKAVSPTGAAAVAEQGPGIRAHVGESGLRSLFHPPIPIKPETRALLPQPWQALSDPALSALLGALGYQGLQSAAGTK